MDLSPFVEQCRGVLESSAKQVRRQIMSAWISNGVTWNLSCGDPTYACTRLNELKIKTRYVLRPANANTPAYFTPTFGMEKENEVPHTLIWVMPNLIDMTLWFGVKPERMIDTWSIETPYLFLVRGNRLGYFLLPLPNQMPDSSLCAGDAMLELRSPTLQGICDLALENLHETAWNTDMAPILSHTNRVFRWDIDGKQLPETFPIWESYLRRANNIAFDHMPIPGTPQNQ